MENLAVMDEYMEMYEDYYDEEWDDGSVDGAEPVQRMNVRVTV